MQGIPGIQAVEKHRPGNAYQLIRIQVQISLHQTPVTHVLGRHFRINVEAALGRFCWNTVAGRAAAGNAGGNPGLEDHLVAFISSQVLQRTADFNPLLTERDFR